MIFGLPGIYLDWTQTSNIVFPLVGSSWHLCLVLLVFQLFPFKNPVISSIYVRQFPFMALSLPDSVPSFNNSSGSSSVCYQQHHCFLLDFYLPSSVQLGYTFCGKSYKWKCSIAYFPSFQYLFISSFCFYFYFYFILLILRCLWIFAFFKCILFTFINCYLGI